MSSVNANAGMKGPTRKRGRTSSPDVTSMARQQQKRIKITLEYVLDLSQSADVVDSPQSSGFVVSQLTLFVLIFAQRALRVISRVFIFAHHELSNISRVLIFAQGHFTRTFFSIIYLKQMKREAKFKEYGI